MDFEKAIRPLGRFTPMLEKVPQAEVERMQRKAVRLIQDGLERVLPGRGLTVQRDGNVWKIVGDLSITSMRAEH